MTQDVAERDVGETTGYHHMRRAVRSSTRTFFATVSSVIA